MCNEHRRTVELGRISDAFAQLRFPEGAPNLAALELARADRQAGVQLSRPIKDSEAGRKITGVDIGRKKD